jgi:hypothetical protein
MLYDLKAAKKLLRELLDQYVEGLISKDELFIKALDVLSDMKVDSLISILEVIC